MSLHVSKQDSEHIPAVSPDNEAVFGASTADGLLPGNVNGAPLVDLAQPAAATTSHTRENGDSLPFVRFTNVDPKSSTTERNAAAWPKSYPHGPFSRQARQQRLNRVALRGRSSPLNVDPMSVLDLAVTDLEQLKLSLIAHAYILSQVNLDELNKLASLVEREVRHSDRSTDRQQRGRNRLGSLPTGYARQDSIASCLSNAESMVEYSAQVGGLGGACDVRTSTEIPTQPKPLYCVWLYDRFVQQYLLEMATGKELEQNLSITAVLGRQNPNGGTKELMISLRGPPKPQNMGELDIFDELAVSLSASGDKMAHTWTESENLEIPLPVYVYVLSRALFRSHFLSRFPAEVFSNQSTQQMETSQTETVYDGTKSDFGASVSTVFIPNVTRYAVTAPSLPRTEPPSPHLLDATFLLEECRKVVLQSFENFDTEQKGSISWSSFTDSLMEQMEVNLRTLRDHDCDEEVQRSDIAVFDECVMEPFPLTLQRLGYVGAVTEVRHSRSAVLVEGKTDFALCDSSHRQLIRNKLLVRSADLLFNHRQGAPEEWVAERWDALAGTVDPQQEEKSFGRGYVHFEDCQREEREGRQNLLNVLQKSKNSAAAAEEEEHEQKDKGKNIRKNVRMLPSIECALEVRDVAPGTPQTIVTLHNDLMLRFFSMEQHIWVVPESCVVSLVETASAMDWCGTAMDEVTQLRTFLFLGTRTGQVLKVGLLGILQKMMDIKAPKLDIITTGSAAASTIRESIKNCVVQTQPIHTDVVTSVCITSGDVMLTASLDSTVVLSRASSMTLLRSFRLENDGGVRLAYITPVGNTIVTLSTSNRVSLWGNTHQSSRVDLYDPISPHYVQIVTFIVDEALGQITTIDTSGLAKVWNLRSSAIKYSFYAVSTKLMDNFGHAMTGESTAPSNGFRLFDEDESDRRRVRLKNEKNSNSSASAFLQNTATKIEAGPKNRTFQPVGTVAYDHLAKRLFVTGAQNSVVCVFISGSVAMKTHSAPPLYVSVCERSRWLVSVSHADCRIWNYQNSKLMIGFKVSNPDFVVARMALAFPSHMAGLMNSHIAATSADADRLTLDRCKQPLPTLDDVIRVATKQGEKIRRERNRGVAASSMSPIPSQTSAGAPSVPYAGVANGTSRGPNARAPNTHANSGTSVEDHTLKNQVATHKVICAHVDPQERFIFYALVNGDVRIHRTKTGQLVKTLLTISPSTELIYAAVLQYRHMYTNAQATRDWQHTLRADSDRKRGGVINIHDVAHVLQRLLRQEYKVPLEQSRTYSIHCEVVGMMTSANTYELCVVYADGVFRFYPILGGSVHAHRIVIPEFLVSKALSYLHVEKALLTKQTKALESSVKNTETDTGENNGSVMVEADAVSFITVSQLLGLICVVQVNGRVSLMNMNTSVGIAVQVFYVSSEVAYISFLGGYPCLVVADVQGTISFYLVRGAPFLELLEDFHKAVVLHRRHQYQTSSQEILRDSVTTIDKLVGLSEGNGQQHTVDMEQRMWSFRVSGTPTAMHFDPCCCTLYIGTQQGFISSYLVRNLVVAFNLHIAGSNKSGRPRPTTASLQRHCDVGEQNVCNVLLVLFNLTPDRVMRYMETKRTATASPSRTNRHAGCTSTSPQPVGPDDATCGESMSLSFRMNGSKRSNSVLSNTVNTVSTATQVDSRPDKIRLASSLRVWRPSLSWIYESCRGLFHSSLPAGTRAKTDEVYSLLDLSTVTLSELLLATAVLHYILQLLQLKRTKPTSPPRHASSRKEDYSTISSVIISASDLRYVRQCILEELHYRKKTFVDIDRWYRAYAQRCVNYNIEELVELDIASNNSGKLSNSISADWVEFLFRRHAVNTVGNSPISLLSQEAILERARRERQERVNYLIQYMEEKNSRTKQEAEGTTSQIRPATQQGSLSFNWNAFLEGSPPDWIAEMLRHRLEGEAHEEECFYLDENDAVQSITTRRNGILYVGSADGSVSVWTLYACARLLEFCPGSPLVAGIRRIGEVVKSQFDKRLKSAETLRQRNAYASGADKQKLHETMMRNIALKYKVCMMKHEAQDSSDYSASRSSDASSDNNDDIADDRRLPPLRRGESQIGSPITGRQRTRSFADLQRLARKPQDLLMASLPISRSEMMEKGIQIEDLYFLPLQTSVLSEVEDFDGKTYAAAVDLGVMRLLKEVCDLDEGSIESCPNSGRCSVVEGSRVNTDEGLGLIFPSRAPSVVDMRARDNEDTSHDMAVNFFATSHDKHMTAFAAEAKRANQQTISAAMRIGLGSNIGRCARFPSISLKADAAASSMALTSSEHLNARTTSCEELCSQDLPSFVQPGASARPGGIILAVSDRRRQQLHANFEFDIHRLVDSVRWVCLEAALQIFVRNSGGALTVESFSGLLRHVKRDVGGSRRCDAIQAEAPSTGTAAFTSILSRGSAERSLHPAKVDCSIDPLLIVDPSHDDDDQCSFHSFTDQRMSERHTARKIACTVVNISEDSVTLGKKHSFFITETDVASSVGSSTLQGTQVGHRDNSPIQVGYGTGPRRHYRGDDDGNDSTDSEMDATVHVRWSLESKPQSHRAKLSRTGRTTMTPSSKRKGLSQVRHGQDMVNGSENSKQKSETTDGRPKELPSDDINVLLAPAQVPSSRSISPSIRRR
ncbi:hypothetical protein ERJ75_000752700 [Trypanosoma vivax]|nr:hypothetical protein ERJ75_000752700 [Trypanosoma vivax]